MSKIPLPSHAADSIILESVRENEKFPGDNQSIQMNNSLAGVESFMRTT